MENEILFAPSWSPDGERLVVGVVHGDSSSTDVGVYVMGADGSDPAEVYRRKQAWAPAPVFTPDGRRIVFWGRLEGEDALLSMRADGSDLRVFLGDLPVVPLRSGAAGPAEPAEFLAVGWSPNGRWMVMSRPTGGGTWLMRADGSGEQYFVSWQVGGSWRAAPPGSAV